MAQRIQIRCTACDHLGRHGATCNIAKVMPCEALFNRTTKHITHVVTADGDSIKNDTDQPYVFANPMLSAFRVGRALLQLDQDNFAWQVFPDSLEKSLLSDDDPFAPIRASTPNKTTNDPNTSTAQSTSTQDAVGVTPSTTNILNTSLMAMAQAANTISANVSNSHQSVAMEQVLSSTPKFNGDPTNFPSWRSKVLLCRKYLDDEQLRIHILSKLGAIPSSYVAGLGSKVNTADGLLSELAIQYDQYSKPMFAETALKNLKQGNRSLEDHHSELYEILYGNKENFQTTNRQIKACYIDSLANAKLKKKMYNMLVDEKPSAPYTLEALMSIATKDAFCAKVAGLSTAPAVAAPTVQSSAVQVTVSETKVETSAAASAPNQKGQQQQQQRPRPNNNQNHNKRQQGTKRGHPNNQRSPVDPNNWHEFCPIHATPGHDYYSCNAKDATECKHCKTTFEPGHYVYHILNECQSPRCHNCNKLGHYKAQCRRPTKVKQNRTDNTAKNPIKQSRFQPQPTPQNPINRSQSSDSRPTEPRDSFNMSTLSDFIRGQQALKTLGVPQTQLQPDQLQQLLTSQRPPNADQVVAAPTLMGPPNQTPNQQ